jgi:electron transfer flavoprotein alpha subunit
MPSPATTLLVALPGPASDAERGAELVAVARRLAAPNHARVALAAATGIAVDADADDLHTLGGDALAVPDVRAWASTLLDVCSAAQPSLVLLGDDPFDRAVAAWMAQRSGGGVVTGGVDLWWDGAAATVTRGVLSGAGLQTCRVAAGVRPFVCLARGATVQGGDITESHNGAPPAAPATAHHRVDAAPSAQVIAERATPQRLRGARVVVAGGAGAGGAEGFAKLRRVAALLGGASGAARGAIVNGWAEPAEKVGLTGATVTADLYLAVGISGASQHMAGCRRSRVIVAVNRDRAAPIFRHATYGLVADSTAVLDALLARLEGSAPVQDRIQDRIAEDAST